MNEKLIDQPKVTPGMFKMFMVGLEIILAVLLAIYFIAISFVFLLSIGVGAFLQSGQLLLMSGGLAYSIRLARHEKTVLSTPLKKFAIGTLLIFLTAINSYYAVSNVDYFFTNSFLQQDSALYLMFVVFLITSCVSGWYFLYQKFPIKSVVAIHSLVVIFCLAFVILQLANVRRNQALVLAAYQESGRALKEGRYEAAYQLMSPDYRQKHTIDDLVNDSYFIGQATEEIDSIYAVGYSIWSHDAHIVVDPGRTATFWRRPFVGISLDFDYVDGKWLLNGQTSFYLDE